MIRRAKLGLAGAVLCAVSLPVLLGIAGASPVWARQSVPGVKKQGMPTRKVKIMKSVAERTQWMADGSYGMMVHYLITPSGDTQEQKTAELNRIIEGFDIDQFIRQFKESGADWLIFTVGQNTGYYNSPNAVIDRLMPGRTPKRDLVVEIAQRVKKLGKHFIAYLPVEMWMQSPEMQKAFQWNPDDQAAFLKTYLGFLQDYSAKLGMLCDGWWFDGCYEEIHRGRWGWENWVRIVRAGNPNTIVAFNDGAFCVGRLKPVSSLQDYHAGEVHLLEDGQIRLDPMVGGGLYVNDDGKLRRPGQEAKLYMPDSRFIDGVQWQALVPVDSSFCGDIPMDKVNYSDAELLTFVSGCKRVKGAVTLNVPIGVDGHIPDASAGKLARLGKALAVASRKD